MTVELTVTSITVQPEISAVEIVVTPTFSSGDVLTAPILSISKNGVNIAPDELKNVDIEVPTKTSDITNDSDFVSDAEYVHTDNNYDNAAVQEVAKIADKQDVTDALLETDSNTIVGAINEVNSIAKGANQALSFNDYQAVIAAMLVSGLNAGQNLYVDTLDVPDLWVKVVEVTSVPYTYVSDTQFVADILAGTQIGYYRLALLETQKVDLTNYYTKDETDQAIEDYAEPLRTTDQNYVSDAELEVLQDTSGVNTGDETQDSLGEKIELTELETVTDTTKIAASDSAFLKWFSGLTIYTYLKGKFDSVYATIANYFSKTESDRRFVNQNGGTIYHITRWFTPTSALTIAANGLSATITSGQFTSGMTGAKLRLNGGVNEPIITYVSANQINLSFAVDSSFFGQSVAIADWGIYERRVELNTLKSDKIIPNSDTTGVVIRNAGDTADVVKVDTDNKRLIVKNSSIYAYGHDSAPPLTGMAWSRLYYSDTYGCRLFAYDPNTLQYKDLNFGLLNSFLIKGDNGNVGISTLMPESKLDVNGTTTMRDWVYLNNGTHTGDAVGDRRFKVVSGIYEFQRCTISNSTKGSGTWVNSSNQLSANTDAANANNVGCQRYRSDSNNSYLEVCMQTGASTYEWIIIKQNTW